MPNLSMNSSMKEKIFRKSQIFLKDMVRIDFAELVNVSESSRKARVHY